MALPKEVAERLRQATQKKRGVLLKDINWRDVPYYMDEIILTCPEASKPIPQEWPDRVPSRLCFLRGVNWSLQEVRDVLYHTLSPWNQDTLRFYRWRQGTHSFFVVGQRKFPDGTSRFTCSAWRQSSGLTPMPGHTWRQGDTGYPFSVIARELRDCQDALAAKPILDKWFLRYSDY